MSVSPFVVDHVGQPGAPTATATSRPLAHPAFGRPRPGPGRAVPVRVGLPAGEGLVVAGLQSLLSPFCDRVVTVWPASLRRPDVEVVDVSAVDPTAPADPRPPWPRVALLWDPSPRSVYLAELLGATCAVPIGIGASELVDTIERVHRRRPASGWAGAGLPVGAAPEVEDGRDGALTARETQVMTRICAGKPNEQIGRELFLSINTVKTYVRTTYQKIGVTTRTQAVLWGLDRGY